MTARADVTDRVLELLPSEGREEERKRKMQSRKPDPDL
jgi:hypothetical protein